jgi:hypothetical protein
MIPIKQNVAFRNARPWGGPDRPRVRAQGRLVGAAESAPELTFCTRPSQLFQLRQKIFKDIAPFTQALMLKTPPDRFDYWSASACRLRF